MDLVVYCIQFWLFALAFIAVRIKGKSGTPLATTIKAVPALLAAAFVLLSDFSNPFHQLLSVSLVFCAFGDIGMEYNILQGLVLFLIAHVCYVAAFLLQSAILGPTFLPLVGFLFGLGALLVYVVLYHRYLQTSESPTPLIHAVDLYAVVISLTASSSLLLWLASGTLMTFLPFLGACFFIISDSLIGIKEFHHHFNREEPLVLGTYYLAIFLLSLSAIIYMF